MLLNIHVKNFALIDEADIDLGSGLNILTGETGAGKSILIDAVSAALGGRCKPDVIGGYGEAAFISLVFSIDDTELSKRLNAIDISTEYDSIIITRKISPDRSVFKINDETVTGAKVREVTELLIDIHGQGEHQSLLKEKAQLEILDRYADNDELLLLCENAYLEYEESRKALERFALSDEELNRQLDFLRYEIDEIEKADVKEGERQELEQSYSKMKSSNLIAEDVSKALKYLSDNNENASELLMMAYKHLESAKSHDNELDNSLKQIADSSEIVSDATRELKSYASSLDYDPGELRRVEGRIDELNRLEQKYGEGENALADALIEKRAKLEELENYDSSKAKAVQEIDLKHNKYLEIAASLSDKRGSAALSLEEKVIDALSGLNFLEVAFKIDFNKAPESIYGIDAVTYLISTNPGEEVKPLSDVASGGELSRIMLGFKTVLSGKDEIGSLIFDEIDSGISGMTANLVSKKLREIASCHQVICITHLPQIAASADAHYLIEKNVIDGRTRTNIRQLDTDGEIDELARMLGGAEITSSTYDNARDLKRLAKA